MLLGCIEPAAYVPIDISGDFLRDRGGRRWRPSFPACRSIPVEADFMRAVALPAAGARSCRSSASSPARRSATWSRAPRSTCCASMRATLGEGAQLLIGMDLIKDVAVLDAAYDDAAGRDGGVQPQPARSGSTASSAAHSARQLRHVARWNDTYARIEMHLEATRDDRLRGRGPPLRAGAGRDDPHREQPQVRSSQPEHAAPRRRLDTAPALARSQGWFSLILADWTIPRGAP